MIVPIVIVGRMMGLFPALLLTLLPFLLFVCILLSIHLVHLHISWMHLIFMSREEPYNNSEYEMRGQSQ